MIVTDVVSIAGNSVEQKLGVALQESVEFSGAKTQFDGLVGTAKGTLSNQKVPTPIEALAAGGVVPGAIMSYDMGRIADGVNNGQVSFGAIDVSRASPPCGRGPDADATSCLSHSPDRPSRCFYICDRP